jgi:hypothetical protein
VNKAMRAEPVNAGSSTNSGQEEQTVTLTEAIKALRTLRAEFSDLRMLIRAARTSHNTGDTEEHDDRAVR